jgi:hypothetical protein
MRIEAVTKVREPRRPERSERAERSDRRPFREHLEQEAGDDDEIRNPTDTPPVVAAQPQIQVPVAMGPPGAPPDIAPPPRVAALESTAAPLPMTPLEQAVHDLLREIEEGTPIPEGELEAPPPVLVPISAPADVAVDAPAPAVAAPRAPSEPPAAAPLQSHVHLVLDEQAGERVVVTVAVRGNDVHVNLRASDDAAAALARNAATLDHSLRLRGLDLAELDVQREPPREQKQQPERQHASNSQPTFNLEEVA